MAQLLVRFEVDVNVDENVDITPFIESDELAKFEASLKEAIEPAVRTAALDSLSKSRFISLAEGLTIAIGTA